jgi:YD repeat-containing protein
LSYDWLNRMTSFAGSNGNNVAYEYDALGRIPKLT